MFSVLHPETRARLQAEIDRAWYDAGNAAGYLAKAAGTPVSTYALAGRLYLSSSGWLLLSVPNAVVRGLFDAMYEPGLELPLKDGQLNGHVSVFTAAETAKIGPDKISERGHAYTYQIGPMQSVETSGWDDVARAFFVSIVSPSLRKLRLAYGLEPFPNGHPFHLTVAIRKKRIFGQNDVKKAADSYADSSPVDEKGDPCPCGECCPHCSARLERGDDGDCNRCGEPWPVEEKESGDNSITRNRVEPAGTNPVSILADLKRAKAESDRGNYAGKHAILRSLIEASPDDFEVDSRKGRFVGVTHAKTGFKIHLPSTAMPAKSASILTPGVIASLLTTPHVDPPVRRRKAVVPRPALRPAAEPGPDEILATIARRRQVRKTPRVRPTRPELA